MKAQHRTRLQRRRAEIARNKAKKLKEGVGFRRSYERLLIQAAPARQDDERVK